MNYFKLFRKLVDVGYLDSEEGSKLQKVGLMVLTKSRRQANGKKSYDKTPRDKRDPAWLSAYNI